MDFISLMMPTGATGTGTGANAAGGSTGMIIMMVALFGIMYFTMVRSPEEKAKRRAGNAR